MIEIDVCSLWKCGTFLPKTERTLHENVLYSVRETNAFCTKNQQFLLGNTNWNCIFRSAKASEWDAHPLRSTSRNASFKPNSSSHQTSMMREKLGFIGFSSCISGKTSSLGLMFDWLIMENKDINRLRLAHATQPSLYILDKITAILEIDIWEQLNGRNKQ